MRPKLELLNSEMVNQIIEEAFAVLNDPGVRVFNDEALTLLAEAGADVNMQTQIARIPESIAQHALETTPSEFYLYTLDGEPVVHYGGDSVQFDPCSTAVTILDSKTLKHRPPHTDDLVKFIKLVETIPQLDAQSTALICYDVVEEIADLYRLYVALNFMRKPIVTGAFRKDTLWTMKEMLQAVVGGEAELIAKPVAVFDVCPSPPLKWSDLTCQNLIDCARSEIPSQIVSMPLAGATAPVTLTGAIIQHTAECMSGVTICQLAKEGAPIVWGGSPAAFDMREGTTPMGDIVTWMIDCAYVQVGKALNMPTNTYLGLSDSKVIDAQCGLESAGGTILAALIGVNMVSAAGMLDFESCQSYEKLVIDAEIIGMAKRLIAGIEARDKPMATTLIRKLGHEGSFLAEPHTLKWFQEELHLSSEVIDRKSLDRWIETGSRTTFERASDLVEKLLATYQKPSISEELRIELRNITTSAARKFGMEELPPLPTD